LKIRTLVLCIRNDGYQRKEKDLFRVCKPLLVFEGKEGGCLKLRGPIIAQGVNVEFSPSKNVSVSIFRRWCDNIIPSQSLFLDRGKHVLYLDNYYSHLDKIGVSTLNRKGYEVRYLPP